MSIDVAQLSRQLEQGLVDALARQVAAIATAGGRVKGLPVRVAQNQAVNGVSPTKVDCRSHNTVAVEVLLGGDSPSATVTVKGSSSEQGPFYQVSDPASQQTLTAADSFDVVVGPGWVEVEVSSLGAGTTVTVIVTPYLSPGQSTVNVNNTASQNLLQVASTTIAAPPDLDSGAGTSCSPGVAIQVPASGGPVVVQGDAANGLDVDVTDKAARDLGKVDVALLDQYTPADVDSGAGTDNALPIALRVPALGGGVTITGDAANGLDVDVSRLPAGSVAAAAAKTADYDTGAGTDTVPIFGLALPAAGGAASAPGDAANGLDVDVTRVSGTVTVDSELPAAAALDDAIANPTAPQVGAANELWNSTTWERQTGNLEGTILAAAARTATTNGADQTNRSGRGVKLYLDVTATPNNAETLTVELQVKDPVSGKYVTVTAFTALTASALGAAPTTETYVYEVYPGAIETAAAAKHEVQALSVPRTWRARVVHSAGGSWTYSLGYAAVL